MDRQARMARLRQRQSRPRETEPFPGQGEAHRGVSQAGDAARAAEARGRPSGRRDVPAAAIPRTPAAAPMKTLSVRAQNVLKELAPELSGEQPPKGTWAPSRELLLALTAERLAAARNCGPHTAMEIVAWAQGCGVTIRPPLQVGRSPSEMWARLVASASAGALSTSEVIEALQKSIRRKSVRIPIAFQIVLVKILLSSFE